MRETRCPGWQGRLLTVCWSQPMRERVVAGGLPGSLVLLPRGPAGRSGLYMFAVCGGRTPETANIYGLAA